MGRRMAVFGSGAVGSYIGGFITRAGHDMTLIDPWGAHVDRMNKHGLRIQGPAGDITVKVNAVHLTDAQRIQDSFDIIFLSVKSYDTEWAAHFAKRLLAPQGIMVSAQNCMNDGLIASIVGYQGEVPCVISSFAVALWEPGFVQRRLEPEGQDHKPFRVGEIHGKITPRVEELTEVLRCVDGAYATANIWGERWSKLTLNAASNPVIAMSGLGAQGLASHPRGRLIYIQLAKECVQVGKALGYETEPVGGVAAEVWARADEGDAFEELDATLAARVDPQDWRSSMAQDIIKGRRTEIEQMNGYIVEKGHEAGIPTPVSAAVVSVVKEIEAGRLKPDAGNIERVLKIAGL